jgi:hypothetical protein
MTNNFYSANIIRLLSEIQDDDFPRVICISFVEPLGLQIMKWYRIFHAKFRFLSNTRVRQNDNETNRLLLHSPLGLLARHQKSSDPRA